MPSYDFQPSGFFVLRTPLYPLESWLDWTVRAASSQDQGRAALRAWAKQSEVDEALWLASASLCQALDAAEQEPSARRAHSTLGPLLRYLTRLATRATPFGLFSGCSVGHVATTTRLELPPRAAYRRVSRMDMDYLHALVDVLDSDVTLRAQLRYRPNTTLHAGSDRYTYTETRRQLLQRSQHVVSIARSPYVEHVLASAQAGALPAQLTRALCAFDPELDADDAAHFVDALIDNQVLISELAPLVSGGDPARGLLAVLRAAGSQHAAALEAFVAALTSLDRAGLGQPRDAYAPLEAALCALPLEAHTRNVVHVDLYKDAPTLSLGPAVITEIQRAVALATQITRITTPDVLGEFRRRYAERYGDRSVGLLDALDPDGGIGLVLAGAEASDPCPLLHGIPFADSQPQAPPFEARERWMLTRLLQLSASHETLWTLDERDVAALRCEREQRPVDAFSAVVSLAARDAAALDRGEFQLLYHGISGPSGAVMAARFGHGDPQLSAALRAHAKAEQALRPEAIYAEVVHLPDGRDGNVIARPQLRDYEIVYLANSAAPEGQRILASELELRVTAERIALYCPRLGKEIVPRLSSAHNYQRAASPVYRFLALLQRQGGRSGIGWHWGVFEALPFLPRVQSGKTVLSLARWQLTAAELQALGHPNEPGFGAAVQALRARRALPRWVTLADGEHLLWLDLDNPLSAASLVRASSTAVGCALMELFPAPEASPVIGPEGHFAHELLVPFVRSAPQRATVTTPQAYVPSRARAAIERCFVPGGRWLYAKLYCGSAAADELLVEMITPYLEALRARMRVERCFFLRYADPEPHLRLRIAGDPADLASSALPLLAEAAEAARQRGRLHRMQLDTYERELERYGGPAGIEQSEAVFDVDSRCVLAQLGRLQVQNDPDARWRLALRGAHLLLTELQPQAPDRLALARRMRDELAQRYGAEAATMHAVARRFRHERASLASLLCQDYSADNPLAPGFALLAHRSLELREPVAELQRLAAEGALTRPLAGIAGSLVHMHVNRLLSAEAPRHEVVLYDFLSRLYAAERALGAAA